MTDPESRVMPSTHGYVQAYNAQAVANSHQIVIAADVTDQVTDYQQFAPMVQEAKDNLADLTGQDPDPMTVLADAGYFTKQNVAAFPDDDVLISPGKQGKPSPQDVKRQKTKRRRTKILAAVEAGTMTKAQASKKLAVSTQRVVQLLKERRENPAGTKTATETMTERLATDEGKASYKRRSAIIEPVFGQIKHDQGIRSFTRRGTDATRAEWKFITATHNLRKVFFARQKQQSAQAQPLPAPA